MAYATYTEARQTNGFAGFVAQLKQKLERRKVYTATVRELSALSNRELADLGLHRSQIRALAREAAYGA